MLKNESGNYSSNRIVSLILISGAGVLTYRTIAMITQGSLTILVFWVGSLLAYECLIDITCIISSIRWLIKNDLRYSNIPLQTAFATTFLHAFRVAIFALGRTSFLNNFDVNPLFTSTHASRWTWPQVYFASIMSILGIIIALFLRHLITNTTYIFPRKPNITIHTKLFTTLFVISICITLLSNLYSKTNLDKQVFDGNCKTDVECPLPVEYAVQSNCPYSTACMYNNRNIPKY